MTHLAMAIIFAVFTIVLFVGACLDSYNCNETRSICLFLVSLAGVVISIVFFALHFG